jgi:hypothetical protein
LQEVLAVREELSLARTPPAGFTDPAPGARYRAKTMDVVCGKYLSVANGDGKRMGTIIMERIRGRI